METLQNITLSQVSEIKLIYNPVVKPSQRPKVTCSKEAYRILLNHWSSDMIEFVEQFKVILLNRASRVLGIVEISTGGVAGTVVDPKIVFGAALKAAASSVILAHNHPSGNLKPSQPDIALTQKLVKAGSFLDISVLEHIILTNEDYYSFADESMI